MTCIVDWNNVCLVCLKKGEHRCIFQIEGDAELSIAEKIMKCSKLSINKSLDRPKNICLRCLGDLNVAFKFYQNCEQSNSIINAILNKGNREPGASGIRIDIPSSLKIKQVELGSVDETLDEAQLTENLIKHENEDCKDSNECENFDSGDCFENTDEVLEDSEDRLEEDADAFEMIEKLDLYSELDDEKPARKGKSKNKTGEPKKRGRPKKSFTQIKEPNYIPKEEPDVSYQRALIQNGKPPKPQKICEICGNSYKYQHALNSHMRRHRNERPFTCEFCIKAFVSAVELRRHMRVHTGQKPYECQYCERRFSDYGSRIKHERTHTGERPYVCAACGKSFAYAHVLTVHMRTHTGEKKFMCTECGRGFTKKAYLDNHMIHHITGTANEDQFEISEAAETIAVYDDKMQIDTNVPPTSDKITPKQERDEVILQFEFQSVTDG